jgi:predicted permease
MNASWRRYVRFWGARVDADVDDELQFHLDMRTRDYMARGMSEPDARREAARRIGDVPGTRDACLTIGHRRQRRMQRALTIDAFAQDVRYALRTLGRQKGWTTVALLTLALGIGASTAVFSVVNSLLLHPLAYPAADRIGTIWRADPKSGAMITPGQQQIDVWMRGAQSFEAIEPYNAEPATLTGRGDAVEIGTAAVRPSFFPFAGARFLRGRAFTREELENGARVAVISESMWRTRFGADDGILGDKIRIDDTAYTVVGVSADGLRLPDNHLTTRDVWLPLVRDTLGFARSAVVRLRPGVDPKTAGAELDSILKRSGVRERFGSGRFATTIMRPGDFVYFKDSLYLLAGAVALLLIVACANVAHLLLARGATRERELAIRTALGAGRMRLMRQLLTESLILASVGGVIGIAIAAAAIKMLVIMRPERLGELANAVVDGRALAVAVAISILTGVAFGFTAAIHAVRRTTSDSLRATALSGTGAPSAHRLRSALVVTEMALSAMLLVGAVLVVRSVANLRRIDPGFRPENLLSARLQLARTPNQMKPIRADFADDAVARVKRVRGVQSVALAGSVPPTSGFLFAQLEAEGSAYNKQAPGALAMNNVAPNFFSTIGLSFVEGSTFSDGALQRGDIIINEGFAKKLWPGQHAVGKRLRTSGPSSKDAPWQTVTGVVRDVPVTSITRDRSEPLIYFPFDPAHLFMSLTLAVRIAPDAAPLGDIRAALGALDSKLPPAKIERVTDALSETIAAQRFTMMLLAAFAGFAVLLSAVGLYGVISYVVTQRTREIGVRIALGATPRHIANDIVARGLVLCGIGLVVGLVASAWGTKLIGSTLYGVTSTDTASYVAAALLLIGVALVGCLVPTRRAMRVDPVIAMRGD